MESEPYFSSSVTQASFILATPWLYNSSCVSLLLLPNKDLEAAPAAAKGYINSKLVSKHHGGLPGLISCAGFLQVSEPAGFFTALSLRLFVRFCFIWKYILSDNK